MRDGGFGAAKKAAVDGLGQHHARRGEWPVGLFYALREPPAKAGLQQGRKRYQDDRKNSVCVKPVL